MVRLNEPRGRGESVRAWLRGQLGSPAVYLVPLRLFIGIGWMRAGVEKLVDPAWYDGTAVTSFIDRQMAGGAIAFPAYQWQSDTVWRAIAAPLGWLVTALELVVGAAILLGAFTSVALLVGIFVNVNFMLAGAINPSAFYIVIQVVVLAVGAGAVFGIDGRLQHRIDSGLLVARSSGAIGHTGDRWAIVVLAGMFAALAMIAAHWADDFSPSGVEDPALVLAMVLAVCSATLALAVVADAFKAGGQTPR